MDSSHARLSFAATSRLASSRSQRRMSWASTSEWKLGRSERYGCSATSTSFRRLFRVTLSASRPSCSHVSRGGGPVSKIVRVGLHPRVNSRTASSRSKLVSAARIVLYSVSKRSSSRPDDIPTTTTPSAAAIVVSPSAKTMAAELMALASASVDRCAGVARAMFAVAGAAAAEVADAKAEAGVPAPCTLEPAAPATTMVGSVTPAATPSACSSPHATESACALARRRRS
mmetsp:Transcript_2954/g.8395  ORF Transcript_2954/g.8395 Transcript_2954/m.8395 type:complete len:229 (-) Transcript_2954:293-979(-)